MTVAARLARLIDQGQGIGLAAAILVFGTIGSRLLGLARDIVITTVFGLGPELDAYYAAFRVPDLIFQLVTGAAVASAFIPTFTGLLARDRQDTAWKLANVSMTIAFLATLTLSLVAIAAAPLFVPLLTLGFDDGQRQTTVLLVRIMLLAPVLFSVSALVMAILNGKRHFLLPALAPWGYNLSIILGALLLGPTLGVASLAVGVVVGAALHLVIQLPGLFRLGGPVRPELDLRLPELREVGALMLPRTFGLAAVYINSLVITAIASLLPSGQLAALNVAWPLMMLPLGLFGWSLAAAAFPALADQLGRGDHQAFRATADRSLRSILFLVVPSSVGLALLAPYLVSALYQRRNFDAAATWLVSEALVFFAAGLIAHAALEILTRCFYAAKDTRTPVALALLSVAINIPLALVLAPLLGHGGLALSISVATLVEAGLLAWLAARRLGVILAPRGLATLLTAAAVMLALLAVFRWAIPPALDDPLAVWLQLAIGMVLGGGGFLAASAALGAEELSWLAGRLLRRLPGPLHPGGGDSSPDR